MYEYPIRFTDQVEDHRPYTGNLGNHLPLYPSPHTKATWREHTRHPHNVGLSTVLVAGAASDPRDLGSLGNIIVD